MTAACYQSADRFRPAADRRPLARHTAAGGPIPVFALTGWFRGRAMPGAKGWGEPGALAGRRPAAYLRPVCCTAP